MNIFKSDTGTSGGANNYFIRLWCDNQVPKISNMYVMANHFLSLNLQNAISVRANILISEQKLFSVEEKTFRIEWLMRLKQLQKSNI